MTGHVDDLEETETGKEAVAQRAQARMTAEATSERAARRSRLRAVRNWDRYLLIVIWLGLFLVFAAAEPSLFLNAATITAIFNSSDIYILLGLAALIPLFVGEFDLSVPYIMGLSATVVPVAFTTWGLPIEVAVILAVLSALAAGILNAFFIVRLKVDPLITTLGTGTVFLAISYAIADSHPASGLTSDFALISITKIAGLNASFWYGLILAFVLAYILSFTPLGRRMRFVGTNREVSRLAGILVNRIRYGSYIFGALIAGVGGILLSARLGSFDPSSGATYFLPTFAVVFVSAAVLTLGRFNPLGVLIAAGFIQTGSLGLQLLGFSGWTQQLFYGASLVLAVTVVTLVRSRKKQR
jgi:ribose transport system permease protein